MIEKSPSIRIGTSVKMYINHSMYNRFFILY